MKAELLSNRYSTLEAVRFSENIAQRATVDTHSIRGEAQHIKRTVTKHNGSYNPVMKRKLTAHS